MTSFRTFLDEKYAFQNTGNSNYLRLDNGEILHYNLNTLNKGYLEVVFGGKVHKVYINDKYLKAVKDITGHEVDLNDEATKKFLSFLPTCGE